MATYKEEATRIKKQMELIGMTISQLERYLKSSGYTITRPTIYRFFRGVENSEYATYTAIKNEVSSKIAIIERQLSKLKK